MHEFLIDSLAAAGGLAAAFGALKTIPVGSIVSQLVSTIRKALSVVASPRISDHWKERVIPAYALRIFGGSLKLFASLIFILGAFALTFSVLWGTIAGDMNSGVARLLAWQPQLIAVGLGIALTWALGRARPASSAYSPMEQALHELALGNRASLQLAFRADCLLPKPAAAVRPVYVSGLARSGTTILLEALHGSGEFTSLSYRNMPFVTAPRLWAGATRWSQKNMTQRERAHGDGIAVSADSPEAFEEVFWMMNCGTDYVKRHGLLPHSVPPAVIEDYRRYVANVVAAAHAPHRRYLAKGNNNLLRLDALTDAFADAVIIIPFREPLAHATSLLRQHQRFLSIHSQDPFSVKYMDWLGHFDFGSNFKPLLFNEIPFEYSPRSIEFWLEYWTRVYEQVLADAATRPQVTLFDYQALTNSPEHYLAALADVLGINSESLTRSARTIEAPTPPPPVDLPGTTLEVYAGLQAQATLR